MSAGFCQSFSGTPDQKTYDTNVLNTKSVQSRILQKYGVFDDQDHYQSLVKQISSSRILIYDSSVNKLFTVAINSIKEIQLHITEKTPYKYQIYIDSQNTDYRIANIIDIGDSFLNLCLSGLFEFTLFNLKE